MPRLAPAVEEHVQPLIYFAGDLLMLIFYTMPAEVVHFQ
jgi:hypothetical protein